MYNNIYGKVYLCLLYKYISDEKFVTLSLLEKKLKLKSISELFIKIVYYCLIVFKRCGNGCLMSRWMSIIAVIMCMVFGCALLLKVVRYCKIRRESATVQRASGEHCKIVN